MPRSKQPTRKLEALARALARNKAALDRFNALTGEEAAALARKGRSKPDAAVERLVKRWMQRLWPNDSGPGERVVRSAELRAIITEARLSAARECAEIAEKIDVRVRGCPVDPSEMTAWVAQIIRERFNLEGK